MDETTIKKSKIIHETFKLAQAIEKAKIQGPWRTMQQVELWADDCVKYNEEIANYSEAMRIRSQVDAQLSDQALEKCTLTRVDLFGESEEEAKNSCQRDFDQRAKIYGEKAFESEPYLELQRKHNALETEILIATHEFKNAHEQFTPQEAEAIARKKLDLPNIITLTKDETPEKAITVPDLYGKQPRKS